MPKGFNIFGFSALFYDSVEAAHGNDVPTGGFRGLEQVFQDSGSNAGLLNVPAAAGAPSQMTPVFRRG